VQPNATISVSKYIAFYKGSGKNARTTLGVKTGAWQQWQTPNFFYTVKENNAHRKLR